MEISGEFKNILKGVTGEFEITRVLGAFGCLVYIVAANGFQVWDVWWKGNDFDVTAYCLAFPGGLAVAVGAISGAVAVKDRAVANARVTEATGTVPTAAPDGPRTPTPVNSEQVLRANEQARVTSPAAAAAPTLAPANEESTAPWNTAR